ncbi:hypothetical protein L6452_32952 [Arctium lappa]|uniref:Uncharacterized protein n=1 Tax=Arctium lappa TaxID=4217 RepID=A0ACB8Z5R4_ARCLA|nr:hypothetical protein L6452_32952 [Arctium lappa]
MKQIEARAKKKAKLVEDIERHMTELQASVELGIMHIGTMERVKDDFGNLMAKVRMLIEQKMMQNEQVKDLVERHKAEMQIQVERRELQIDSHKAEIQLEGHLDDGDNDVGGGGDDGGGDETAVISVTSTTATTNHIPNTKKTTIFLVISTSIPIFEENLLKFESI